MESGNRILPARPADGARRNGLAGAAGGAEGGAGRDAFVAGRVPCRHDQEGQATDAHHRACHDPRRQPVPRPSARPPSCQRRACPEAASAAMARSFTHDEPIIGWLRAQLMT
jgi:hypothetical protein